MWQLAKGNFTEGWCELESVIAYFWQNKSLQQWAVEYGYNGKNAALLALRQRVARVFELLNE